MLQNLQSDIFCIMNFHLKTVPSTWFSLTVSEPSVRYILNHAIPFYNCTVHLNCLSLLCSVYQFDMWDRCMTNQRRCTIRYLLYTKHDTPKLLTIFNDLRIMISLLFAAFETTTALYTTWRRTQFGVISRYPFCWFSIVFGFEFQSSAFLSLVPIDY